MPDPSHRSWSSAIGAFWKNLSPQERAIVTSKELACWRAETGLPPLGNHEHRAVRKAAESVRKEAGRV